MVENTPGEGSPRSVTPIAEKTADVVLALPPDPSAARLARHALHEARLPEDLEHTVDLLATEVVSNAVRHAGLRAGDRILFAARFVEDHIRVEVGSPGPTFDREQALQGSGYGLRMVDKLAAAWGIEPGVTGSRVWFEIDRRSQRRFPRREAA
jgi:anti-sigma regulatory factor (Ser/Thr protein kinase)